MADALTRTHYEIILSCRDAADPKMLDNIVVRLAALDGAQVVSARRIETMGMTAKDAFFTIMLGLPTSVAANFATDAIKAAFAGDAVVAQVKVDDVAVVDDPTSPPNLPIMPASPVIHRRNDDD